MRTSPSSWMSRVKRSRTGEDGSARRACKASRRDGGLVARGPPLPPAQIAEVKALGRDLPAQQGVPLSR